MLLVDELPPGSCSLATDGDLAAWGYTDGTVIVLDTGIGTVWKLQGHPGPVTHIVLDVGNARVVTASSRELRIWQIRPAESSTVSTIPCSIFHAAPSLDGTRVALDCSDGSVRAWQREGNLITRIHQHNGIAIGVQWVRGKICSAGWGDGRVLCSMPDGTATMTIDSRTSRITTMTTTPDQQTLIFASADGRIWRFDEMPQVLYSDDGVPNRLAISSDGRLMAWSSFDGSFDVYDLVARRPISHLMGHVGATSSVAWVGDELWTTGDDGTLKKWRVRDGVLKLQHNTRVSAVFRWTKVARGGWAASVGASILYVSLDGSSIALRLDVGKNIDALDVSRDLRYVAAAGNSEVIIVDMHRNAIATLTIRSPLVQQIRFLDSASLTFNEADALKTLRVDSLDYVAFQTESAL